jgi:hypothetical protein
MDHSLIMDHSFHLDPPGQTVMERAGVPKVFLYTHISIRMLTSGVYTVHSESIQTPQLLPHFIMLQPYLKIYKIVIFRNQSIHNSQ